MRAKVDEDTKTILARIERKLPKQVIGIVPAFPLYSYCAAVLAGEVLLRYMFALPGTIPKIFVRAEGATAKKPLMVKVDIIDPTTGQYVEGELRKTLTEIEANLKVVEGSRLIVTALGDWDGPIEVAAIFSSSIGRGEVHQVMREELENASVASPEGPSDEGA